jgi:hypothetical protein
MKCPPLIPAVIIADDARLAARVSCLRARSGQYLSLMDGPRLGRPDRRAEVIRRNNATARVGPDELLLVGLSDESVQEIRNGFSPGLVSKIAPVANVDDLQPLAQVKRRHDSMPLPWGHDRIGIGLLKALRLRREISFDDSFSPVEDVPTISGHLVVCEDGDDMAQVIAANYAHALGAGLSLIPEVAEQISEQILDDFYTVYDRPGVSVTEALAQLKDQLRALCGDIPVPDKGSITFITARLPCGFAFPEVPSTHLFRYPDLGISIINGLAAEQPKSRGVAVTVFVDPETTDAPEIDEVKRLLPPRGVFLRGYEGPNANVRAVADMIEMFPFDFLIIATHCGDASGYRWTYEFTDSEGRQRSLVVDIAIGLARTDDEDVFNVTQYMRFISLDNIDWHDPDKSEKLYIGTAMNDFIARTRSDVADQLEPVKKETVARVVWSAALKMSDYNYIALPQSVADVGTPIILNNACASWHQLASTFTFAGARAYIGTLFSVTTSEAHDVAVGLVDKHHGKPLPTALWSAQRKVYGDSHRCPYVITGVYPQRLRVPRQDTPRYIIHRLSRALQNWTRFLEQLNPDDQRTVRAVSEKVEYYRRELQAFREKWSRSEL